jgi:hypothetical protein
VTALHKTAVMLRTPRTNVIKPLSRF